MSKFTKIYDTESEKLFKTNSVSAFKIYFHLKNDSSYFKGEFYDLTRCIGEYLNIPERTVKDGIKRLIEVGLVEVKKKGKVNYYTLPFDGQNIEITRCKDKYDETTGNDVGGTDSIGETDKTGDIETGRTEHSQAVYATQENKQKRVGEEGNTSPDNQTPTDEEILIWIKQGYEMEYILKNWRSIRKIMVS